MASTPAARVEPGQRGGTRSVGTPALLEVDSVNVHFGGIRAVQDVSLAVAPGEFAGLIGPNGAGKTTLFKLIAGEVRPDGGQVRFDGHDITRMREHRIVRLGLARTFQHTALFPRLTVLENVLAGHTSRMRAGVFRTLIGSPGSRRDEADARQEAARLLARLGIEKLKDSLASDLSYGDARRVAIARALATNPKLLMLDEPAAGLNDVETRDLGALLDEIRRDLELALLVIEHDMDLIMRHCEHIVVLNFGQTLAEGTPKEIQQTPAVVEAYLGAEDDDAGA